MTLRAEDLREQRINLGYSLREAAAEMGIPYHVLREAEKFGRAPVPSSAKAIADFFAGHLGCEIKVTDIWPLENGDPEPESTERAA